MRRALAALLLCHFVAQHYCRNVAAVQKGIAPQSDLGTDVIEISNARDNGLPPDVDEEPSEQDILEDTPEEGETKPAATTTADMGIAAATDESNKLELDKGEDEASLAKKLDAFYKDTDEKKDHVSEDESQPEVSARRTFQPDLNNPEMVEKYRTAQDSVSCRTSNPLSGNASSKSSIIELGWSMIVTSVLLAISRRNSYAYI